MESLSRAGFLRLLERASALHPEVPLPLLVTHSLTAIHATNGGAPRPKMAFKEFRRALVPINAARRGRAAVPPRGAWPLLPGGHTSPSSSDWRGRPCAAPSQGRRPSPAGPR